MKTLILYEPAMCCSTGVCGPSVDPELVRISGDVDWLEKNGVKVTRYNLSSNTQAFVENKEIKKILFEEGNESLPITLIEGRIFNKGKYPAREELADALGLKVDDNEQSYSNADVSGCGGDEGCC